MPHWFPLSIPVTLGLGLLPLALSGCRLGWVRYPEDLSAQDPRRRIRAIRIAGERSDESAMPILVERLEDPDEAVRFFAIQALRQITGTDLGYVYYKPEGQRVQAVDRWRRYLQQRSSASDTAVGTDSAIGALP